MCTVAAASGAASVRVWHLMSRGWHPWTEPWTERPLPKGVRVAYPLQKERRHSAVGFLYTLLRRRRRSRPRPARAVPKSASDAGSGTFVPGGVVELLNEALI